MWLDIFMEMFESLTEKVEVTGRVLKMKHVGYEERKVVVWMLRTD